MAEPVLETDDQDVSRDTAGTHHPGDHLECSVGITLFNQVGQIPDGHLPLLTEVGSEHGRVDGHVGAIGRCQGLEDSIDSAEVVAEVVGQELRRRRIEAHRCVTEMVGEIGLLLPMRLGPDGEDLTDSRHCLLERGGRRPAIAREHQHRTRRR